MTKRVEFHQAQVTVAVKIVDDERSYGQQSFDTVVLMNTNADWADLREKIDNTIVQFQKQLDEAELGTEITE